MQEIKENIGCKTSSLSARAAVGDSCCGETPVEALKASQTGESAGGAVCDLEVGGMDCTSCADDITRALGRLEGIQDLRVYVVGRKVRIAYADGKLTRGDLA